MPDPGNAEKYYQERKSWKICRLKRFPKKVLIALKMKILWTEMENVKITKRTPGFKGFKGFMMLKF